MTRENDLLTAADKFIAAHNHWVDSVDTTLVTQAYEDALVECVEEFSSGDLPASCRTLAAAVGSLSDEWKAYEWYVSQSSPMPKDTFWAAVQSVIDERSGRIADQRKPIEPVRVLLKQKVTPRQIAIIYSHDGVGPFMRNGIPQEHLVLQEKERPGSVIPEGWVHPADEARLAESRKLEARRISRLESKGPAFKPCPESIAELLQQKVFPNQIAKMHGVSLDTVLAEAKRLDIATTGSPTDELDLARNHNPLLPEGSDTEDEDDDLPEAEAEDEAEAEAEPDDAATLEDQILALAGTGLSAGEIAKQLDGCSVQKAAAVIRRSRVVEQEPVAANG